MNDVNGSIELATAHRLRSVAAALRADASNQIMELRKALWAEADSITARADSIEEQVPPVDPVEALVQAYAARDWDAAEDDGGPWRYFITPSRLREFAAEVLRIGVGEAPKKICGDQIRSFGIELLCRLQSGHDGDHKAVDGASWVDQATTAASLGALSVRAHQEKQGARFCTLTQNCRLADGHADGCRP